MSTTILGYIFYTNNTFIKKLTVARAADAVDTNTQYSPQEIQLVLGPGSTDAGCPERRVPLEVVT